MILTLKLPLSLSIRCSFKGFRIQINRDRIVAATQLIARSSQHLMICGCGALLCAFGAAELPGSRSHEPGDGKLFCTFGVFDGLDIQISGLWVGDCFVCVTINDELISPPHFPTMVILVSPVLLVPISFITVSLCIGVFHLIRNFLITHPKSRYYSWKWRWKWTQLIPVLCSCVDWLDIS